MTEKEKRVDVFISHSSNDRDLAQYFCNLLEGDGLPCWIAPRDIPVGKNWAGSIEKGIEACSVVAFLVSEASVASEEVANEIHLAMDLKKWVIQIRLEDTALPTGMRYRLSNKQWVDALNQEKSIRFDNALSAIQQLLHREKTTVVVEDTSIIGQSRNLLKELRQKHGAILDELNIILSMQEEGENHIKFYLPLQFGANGIILIFDFDGSASPCTMELYADTASSGDPLKKHFFNFLKQRFEGLFPQMETTDNRRWKVFQLMKPTQIPSPLIDPLDAFSIYRAHLLKMSEKVFPAMLQWAEYARDVCKAVERLQDELKKVFPKEEGWRVGAPEGSRIDGLRNNGAIYIFKKAWQPTHDDYHDRGWLSLCLKSDGDFLSYLRIGITKYEKWHDLGEWNSQLVGKAKQIFSQEALDQNDDRPFYFTFAEPWNESGIARAEFKWKDRLDPFIAYCVDQFKALKPLENIMDQACQAIPSLQDKDPATIPVEQQQNWWIAHQYIRNRLRLIQEELVKQNTDPEFDMGYRYRGGNDWNDLLIQFKIGHFEAAIVFQFAIYEANIEIKSVEPPDIETEVVKAYLKRRIGETCLSENLQVATECNGASVREWMDTVQAFIISRTGAFMAALHSLKAHLQEVIALTEASTAALAEIFNPSEGWVIDNQSKTLEPEKPIAIYHKAWRRTDEEPPLVSFQIVPNAACFDELSISIHYSKLRRPEHDLFIGQITGGCTFAFGPSDATPIGLWSRRLDPPYSITGGCHFEKPLVIDTERNDFLSHFKTIAGKLNQLRPLADELAGAAQS